MLSTPLLWWATPSPDDCSPCLPLQVLLYLMLRQVGFAQEPVCYEPACKVNNGSLRAASCIAAMPCSQIFRPSPCRLQHRVAMQAAHAVLVFMDAGTSRGYCIVTVPQTGSPAATPAQAAQTQHADHAYQHAVAIAIPSSRQSTTTADRMDMRECQTLCPYLQQQQHRRQAVKQALCLLAMHSTTVAIGCRSRREGLLQGISTQNASGEAATQTLT